MNTAAPFPISSPVAGTRGSHGGDRRVARTTADGFTLIELAVTLAVFGLLLAIVAPAAGNWLANMQIRAAAESIQTGLQKARMEAVRRNQPIRFSLVSTSDSAIMDNSCALSSSSASWTISVNSPAGKCGNALSNTADPMLVEPYAAGANARRLRVSATEANGTTAAHSVVFDGFGRILGANALARVDIDNAVAGNDFRPLRVVISDGGSIRMCEPRVSTSTDPRVCQ
jgi:type IV fimbrial biogenesis protein FimT